MAPLEIEAAEAAGRVGELGYQLDCQSTR